MQPMTVLSCTRQRFPFWGWKEVDILLPLYLVSAVCLYSIIVSSDIEMDCMHGGPVILYIVLYHIASLKNLRSKVCHIHSTCIIVKSTLYLNIFRKDALSWVFYCCLNKPLRPVRLDSLGKSFIATGGSIPAGNHSTWSLNYASCGFSIHHRFYGVSMALMTNLSKWCINSAKQAEQADLVFMLYLCMSTLQIPKGIHCTWTCSLSTFANIILGDKVSFAKKSMFSTHMYRSWKLCQWPTSQKVDNLTLQKKYVLFL